MSLAFLHEYTRFENLAREYIPTAGSDAGGRGPLRRIAVPTGNFVPVPGRVGVFTSGLVPERVARASGGNGAGRLESFDLELAPGAPGRVEPFSLKLVPEQVDVIEAAPVFEAALKPEPD